MVHDLTPFSRPVVTVTVLAALFGCVGERSGDAKDAGGVANAVNGTFMHATIRTREDCAGNRCEIVLSHVGTIPDTNPAIHVGERPAIHMTSRGRLIATGVSQLLLYETSGVLVTAAGRHGSGPGEFTRLGTMTLGPGDSVHAWDFEARRLSVFTPELVFVRSIPLRHAPAFVLADGSYLLAAQIQAPDRVGKPMHRVTASGEFERSFGSNLSEYRPDLHLRQTRVVGPGRDGTIWAAPPGEYRIEQWNPLAGDRLASITLESSWFRESAEHGSDLHSSPSPIIIALWEDSLGFVWILSRDADLQWAPSPNRETHRPVPREEIDGIYDWVLEVIDPQGRKAVASLRFPDSRRTRPPSRLLVSSASSATLETIHKIWRPALVLRADSIRADSK